MKTERIVDHLEKLKIFNKAAETSSLQKAAIHLRLTQPAVSRSIKALEDALECKLMNRNSRGIELTKEGIVLRNFALGITRDIEKLKDALSLENDQPLTIATYDNIACNVITSIAGLSNFNLLTQHANTQMLADLMSLKTDCAILAEPRSVPGVNFLKIHKERYAFFASRKFLKARGISGAVKLRELEKLPFFAIPEAIAGQNKNIDRLLWELKAKQINKVNSYEVATQLILNDIGIGIIPHSSAYRLIKQKDLVEISVTDVPQQFGAHDIYLCWNNRAENNQQFLNFKTRLIDFYKALS